MSALSDIWIKRMVIEHQMISPFVGKQVKNGNVSYGLSSYGYDLRVAPEFKLFTNVHSAVVDPKDFNELSFVDVRDEKEVLIPPNSFALTRSLEYLKIPKNVLGLCIGKSTYARCGIIVNVTPLQPEWEGSLIIEISNTTPLPAKIYSGEGIAHIIFFQGNEEPEKTYKEISGLYSNQKTIVLPRV
ncbi:dCTP deaminase [Candidatus Roizmanbacteria bacterium CG11_big_fil_rev_8_21_14_0_20_36_8]|uniref:dCTP deaminase n=2 Tax=Candidatus Roizmaniibacteriota TaxID=1752723 RepID=A0A2M6IT71_9BACT|nr:MAG: dCTP deaminase [Candidatus Roizmanbacteria bacterium CG11_big_fil_rev_8_21_14_0_20_36_8]PIZ64564.1 MAG: dCTP deaminase [Candidatus Roizmanbacteria bacterium CG_4_10_14_0_2_um_filter_36_9]